MNATVTDNIDSAELGHILLFEIVKPAGYFVEGICAEGSVDEELLVGFVADLFAGEQERRVLFRLNRMVF